MIGSSSIMTTLPSIRGRQALPFVRKSLYASFICSATRPRYFGGGGDGDPAGCCACGVACLGVPARLRGGATGSSITFTGLGIKVGGGPFENKECSGGAPTLTRTVCDMKPVFSNVTDWLSDGTAREQGV